VSDKDEGMDKYAVVIDPKKAAKEKTAGKDKGKTNVPHDPDKGTEPFEKKTESSE
jgi:hypothetical protein